MTEASASVCLLLATALNELEKSIQLNSIQLSCSTLSVKIGKPIACRDKQISSWASQFSLSLSQGQLGHWQVIFQLNRNENKQRFAQWEQILRTAGLMGKLKFKIFQALRVFFFSYSFEEVRRTFHPQILRVKDRCVCMDLMHDVLMIYSLIGCHAFHCSPAVAT